MHALTLTVLHAVKSSEHSEGFQLYGITIVTFSWFHILVPCVHIHTVQSTLSHSHFKIKI